MRSSLGSCTNLGMNVPTSLAPPRVRLFGRTPDWSWLHLAPAQSVYNELLLPVAASETVAGLRPELTGEGIDHAETVIEQLIVLQVF